MRANFYAYHNTKIACMQINNEQLITFGKHIKNLRKERKITLTNLCYKNGLEPSTISRMEMGLVEPKLFTLVKLAKAMKTDMNNLIDLSIFN